ncbi:MAG: carboxypeptidase-like regulatory domain-containing protein, partial [Flavobacteriaceae bacterium]|nr:carboxypeptidase-like regulatory domain-containing protein [Flavobacteriaceae bacterium]
MFLLLPILLFSQDYEIEGKVVDANNETLSFVNVLLFENEEVTPITGSTTNDYGVFKIKKLEAKEYTLEISMIGFHTISRKINLSENNNLGMIQLKENIESLDETVISIKRPTIKKEAGKLIFSVENTSLSTGNTYSLLSKTPGVLVIGDQISIKNSSTLIFLNGKRVYLSASELSSLLKNMDASVIKSIEVITNPSAKYDAEAESVLNIITSKAISIGYKGSVYGTYEQSVYPKYNFGTSHFYKNDFINLYANYSYSPRKEYKQDDNDIRFFNPNGEIKSIWDTDFNRTTKSYTHQGNIIADFDLKNDQSLSLSLNVNISPNKMFSNNVHGDIYNAQHLLDSIFKTKSTLENDTKNFSVNAEHKIKIGEKGANLTTSVNYINYSNKQDQNAVSYTHLTLPTNSR